MTVVYEDVPENMVAEMEDRRRELIGECILSSLVLLLSFDLHFVHL